MASPNAVAPRVESPFEGRRITPTEHLKLAAYWFGSNFVWGAFLGPVLSSQMTRLSPENSASTLGVLYGIGAIPALFIPLIVGPLSDRCTSRFGRRRPFILGGSLVGMLGLLLMALGFEGASIAAYIGGYLVLQVGANTALAAYSGVIPDLVPVDQRGIASGYMAVMSQLATLAGAISSGQMIDRGLHIPVFATIAGVYALFVAISMSGVKERQVVGDWPPFRFGDYLKSLWIDPRKYPDFAWVWITRALMMLGFYLIQPFLLYYLRDVVHVAKPASTSSIVFGIILLAATFSGFVGGWISDRTGRKPVVVYSSLVIALTCCVLVFCQNLEQALAVGLVFGLGYGAYVSVDWALGTDVLPNKHDAAKDMAVWHVSMTLPQQVAPLIGGSLILGAFKAGEIVENGERIRTYAWPGYVVLFFLAATFFFLGGVLVKKVKGAR
jgi:MFS family permease